MLRCERPDDKAAWRNVAREARARIDRATWSRQAVAAMRAWPVYRAAATVAIYLAFGSEADLAGLTDDPKRFAAPRTDDVGRTMTMRLLGGPLSERAWGLREPLSSAPPVATGAIDLVVVPGLAFDAGGVRLGYGGGYYDRWLASLPAGVPRVGVAHPDLIAAELPAEPHDARLSHLLLPAGVQACGDPPATAWP